MSQKKQKQSRQDYATLAKKAKQFDDAQIYLAMRASNQMYQYNELLQSILHYGSERTDRTGVGTISLFAPAQLRFNLKKGFPLVGIKKVSLKNIVAELLWLLSGSTNIKDLHKDNCHIWDEWADDNGDLGKIYGYQWRKANGIDQIKNLIEGIKKDPYSRRHIVNAWNVQDLPQMALTPCHHLFQCYVSDAKDGGAAYLSLHMSQRRLRH